MAQTARKQGGGPQAPDRAVPLGLAEAAALVDQAFRDSRAAARAEAEAPKAAASLRAPKAAAQSSKPHGPGSKAAPKRAALPKPLTWRGCGPW